MPAQRTQITRLATQDLEPVGRTNPFKGLAYFAEADRDSFGGRERDVRTVAAGILKSRTFLLYGRSGLGKTSLLRAGIFPDLRQHQGKPVYVRALVDPLKDLHTALVEQLEGDPSRDLRGLIDDADNEGPVVVFFDQFEEFFLRFPPARQTGAKAMREGFLEALGQLAKANDLNLRLVFSLREDWVASMKDLERFIPGVLEPSHRLLPLTAFGVRQAILQALKAGGTGFDPRLISALVEELAQVDFDPAVLQVVCSEIWKEADRRTTARQGLDGAVRMTLADMEAVGGVAGIFQGYLREVARELPPEDRRLQIQTRAVLDSLITEHGTKRAVPYTYFADRGFEIEADELDRVLTLLCEQRLVRRERRGEDDWFELIHERLIPTIRDWLDADEDFWRFRAAGNLVENSCSNLAWKENAGLLLSREQLDHTVGPYKHLLRFTEEQKMFLLSSAIYSGSQDLEGWGSLAGSEASRQRIEAFLKDQDSPAARAGAARAAGRMAPRSASFATVCLEVALEDPEAEVREAAAQSFARLAGEDDLAELAQSLGQRHRRARARQVLQEVVQRGLPSKHPFRLWQVAGARRMLRHRRLQSIQDPVRARGSHGALVGAVVATVFTLVAGSLMIYLFLAEFMPGLATRVPAALPISVGLALLSTVPFGALVGWLAARAEAQQAHLLDQEGSPHPVLWRASMNRLVLIPVLALVAYLVAVNLAAIPSLRRWESLLELRWALLVLLLLVITWPVALILIGLVEAALRPLLFRLARQRGLLYLWVVLWSLGGGLFLPLLVWSQVGIERALPIDTIAAGGGDFSTLDTWLLPVVSFCLHHLFTFGSLTLACGSLAVVCTSPAWGADFPADLRLGKWPAPPVSAARRGLSAVGGLVLMAGVVILIGQLVGFDSWTRWQAEEEWRGETPLEIEPDFAAGLYDTDWWTFEMDVDQPRLVRVEGLVEGLKLYQQDTGLVANDAQVVLQPGRVQWAMQWDPGRNPPRQVQSFRVVPLAGEEESPLGLVTDNWRTTLVRLDYDGGGVWQGVLAAQTPGGPGDEGRELLVEVSPLVCEDPSDLRAAGGLRFQLDGRPVEEDTLSCAATWTRADFLKVPLPAERRQGEFDLHLALVASDAGLVEEGEEVHLFLRLGWYRPDRHRPVSATSLPEGLCDPTTDTECEDRLRRELTELEEQITWWQTDTTTLRQQREQVWLDVLLDELAAGQVETILQELQVDDLQKADRRTLRRVESAVDAYRESVEGAVVRILAIEPADRIAAPRRVVTAKELRQLMRASKDTPDPTLVRQVSDFLEQPALRLRVALEQRALDGQIESRRRQIAEAQREKQTLEGRLGVPGEEPAGGTAEDTAQGEPAPQAD